MSYDDPRLTLIVQLVAVGEEMNRVGDSPLSADELQELWNSLNSQRTALWRHLGIDKSTLISAPTRNGTTWPYLYPLVDVNWRHWLLSSGNGIAGPAIGMDTVNLPASGVAGRDVVTIAVKLKWNPSGNLDMGGDE
jgi:hypothetical protein